MINNKWTTWFISDIHFNHTSVIDFCKRPFDNVEEMNEKIIENWNKLVKPKDLCIFVGDIAFYTKTEKLKEILDSMNGRKILVKGNHDRTPRSMMNSGFEICVDEMTMTIANERVTISHYPFRSSNISFYYYLIRKKIYKLFGIKRGFVDKFRKRRPEDKGQFLIHGHTHNKDKVRGRMIHVGVDARNFKPVNIQTICNEIGQIKEKEKR